MEVGPIYSVPFGPMWTSKSVTAVFKTWFRPLIMMALMALFRNSESVSFIACQ